MRRLILAAALAAASTSFALAPAFANAPVIEAPFGTYSATPEQGTSPDNPGVADLGIDISGVNLSPSSVHSFLSTLSPETRRSVEAACTLYSQHPAGAGEKSLAFCADAKA